MMGLQYAEESVMMWSCFHTIPERQLY